MEEWASARTTGKEETDPERMEGEGTEETEAGGML